MLGLIAAHKRLISESCELLKVKDYTELPVRIAHFVEESHNLQGNLTKMRASIAALRAKTLYSDMITRKGVSIITARMDGENNDMLRDMSQTLISNRPSKLEDVGGKLVIVLAAVDRDKGGFAVACSKEAVAAGLKAGDIVREVAKITGGNGGGRPDFAMAGAKDNTLIDRALAAVDGIVASSIKD